MFVILSSNLLSIIEDTLKVQCLSKCKMHCLLWRKYLDENEKGWACTEKHTHIWTQTQTCALQCPWSITFTEGCPWQRQFMSMILTWTRMNLFSSHLPLGQNACSLDATMKFTMQKVFWGFPPKKLGIHKKRRGNPHEMLWKDLSSTSLIIKAYGLLLQGTWAWWVARIEIFNLAENFNPGWRSWMFSIFGFLGNLRLQFAL